LAKIIIVNQQVAENTLKYEVLAYLVSGVVLGCAGCAVHKGLGIQGPRPPTAWNVIFCVSEYKTMKLGPY